jgi:hypothetical protein
MKLTKSKLQQIIKEELSQLIEGPFDSSGWEQESDESDDLVRQLQWAGKQKDIDSFEGLIQKAMDIARGYPEMKQRLGAGIQQMLSGYDDNDLRDMGIKDLYSAAMSAL